MSRKRIVTLCIAVIAIVGLGSASYAVIDRYRADRAEATVVSSTTEASATAPTQASSATSPAVSGETSSRGTTTSPTSQLADAGDEEYTATDTSYTSTTKSISIEKVTAGTGSEKVTYYVADVQLTSGTDLQSAFAGGQFGSEFYQDTSAIAAANDAIVAVNGDFCGAMSSGVVIRNGVLYRNDPVRLGLAVYKDGTMKVYDETEISAEELLADGVWNSYSFGPALLDDGVITGDLDTTEIAGVGMQHTILGNQPRTGIGIVDQNHFLLVVVDGRQKGYSRGVSLSEFAQIFKDLGCTTAYNLDGGGSSTMYFMGNVVNSPSGNSGERAISDILFVG